MLLMSPPVSETCQGASRWVPVWAGTVKTELFRPWLAMVRTVSTDGWGRPGGTFASGPKGWVRSMNRVTRRPPRSWPGRKRAP